MIDSKKNMQYKTDVHRIVSVLLATIVIAGQTPLLVNATEHTPQWVSTLGTRTPFSPPDYLIGFGTDSTWEHDGNVTVAREAARQQAIAHLAEKISVTVRSNSQTRTRDSSTASQTLYTNVINTSTDLQLEGVQYETYMDGRRMYALAYVSVPRLRARYMETARDLLTTFDTQLHRVASAIDRGDTMDARRVVTLAQGTIDAYRSAHAVWHALGRESSVGATSVSSMGNQTGISGPVEWLHPVPAELNRRFTTTVHAIEQYTPPDETSAARHIAGELRVAGIDAATVRPLLYQDGDFSSAFGARFASMIATFLAGNLRETGTATATGRSGGSDSRVTPAVVRGSYWVTDNAVTVSVLARGFNDTENRAGVTVTIPIEAIENPVELEPANFAQALQNGAALMSDAVVDGGLTIEVYTTEGTGEDILVYEEGDTIQFFFRVNQPAFLRLTYELATGEMVLLEDSFYIGLEMVNRPVRLPYTFTVVPPLGVERLIVTGTTAEPPPARTYPTTIDGQSYDVFHGVADVVAHTRGLAKTPTEERDAFVGETHVVLTTIRKATD